MLTSNRPPTTYREVGIGPLRKAVHLILWGYAHDQVQRGKLDAALRTVVRMRKLAPLLPAQHAFEGMVFLMAHRFDEAEAVWWAIIEAHKADLTPNTRYAFLFARARLHALDGNLDLCARDERDMLALKCQPIIKRILPGPELIGVNDL